MTTANMTKPGIDESPRYLLLATDNDVQGGQSSYTQLAKHISGSTLLHRRRREARGVLGRAAIRALNVFAASRWYRLSSVQLELRAWARYQSGSSNLIHFLWGERDWGLIDRLPSVRKLHLCGTFHSCADTLPGILRADRIARLRGVILVSETQRSFFLDRGVKHDNIEVIHHGVDCEFFSPNEDRSGDEFTVLFVGSYRRRFDLLKQVIDIINRAAPDVGFIIVAPPERTSELGSLPRVRIAHDVSYQELRRLYNNSSCLLMTLEQSTANNAILEAMACGLPIVSEDVGGVREYVGNAGLLTPPGSAEELATAILCLRENRELTNRLGHLARARSAHFDWPLVAQRTEAFYQRVLQS